MSLRMRAKATHENCRGWVDCHPASIMYLMFVTSLTLLLQVHSLL